MSKKTPSIVWLRRDLRLADNPALDAACQTGGPVIIVYIHAPQEEGAWPLGAASCYWLHHSLASLQADLKHRRTQLILRQGKALDCLLDLAKVTKAARVYWNERYEPAVRIRDTQVVKGLHQHGLETMQFTGSLLLPVECLLTKAGGPYQVFTPFYNAFLRAYTHATPLPIPERITTPEQSIESLPLSSLKLTPRVDWAFGIRSAWRFGEAAAIDLLQTFSKESAKDYHTQRDLLAMDGTSKLSPYLAHGELSPRQVWDSFIRGGMHSSPGHVAFLRQLIWREFAYHLLWHFPSTPEQPLRKVFRNFPWRKDSKALECWQHGITGYPLVDAAMHQLWQTGWMHNRARMVAASFLTKHLMLPWQLGACWFWDTLVDADLANNTFGWQWTAGCGADAAPYFRIFNPALQAVKFDPDGDYIARYMSDMQRVIGDKYHSPIVEHRYARERALAAYAQMRQSE